MTGLASPYREPDSTMHGQISRYTGQDLIAPVERPFEPPPIPPFDPSLAHDETRRPTGPELQLREPYEPKAPYSVDLEDARLEAYHDLGRLHPESRRELETSLRPYVGHWTMLSNLEIQEFLD